MRGVGLYLLGRVMQGLLVLIFVSMLTFLALNFLPVYAPSNAMGTVASGVVSEPAFIHLALPVQYLRWITGLLAPKNLKTVLALTVPTLALLTISGAISLVVALTLASIQARFRGRLIDRMLGTLAYALYTLPAFWVGLMLLWVFADVLLWLPATGPQPVPSTGLFDWPMHMILPVATMVITTVASWANQFRSAMEAALVSDYVRTARAKGVHEGRILRRHVLRPASLPVITAVGMSLPTMFNNLVGVEVVFVMSGLGGAITGMIGELQYGVSGYLVLAIAAITFAGSLFADVLYAMADPRIQFAG